MDSLTKKIEDVKKLLSEIKEYKLNFGRKSAKRGSKKNKRSPNRKSAKRVSKRKSANPVKRSCSRQTQSKYTSRPSPPYPANECCGMEMTGNDGETYVSRADANGVCKWYKL